MERQATRYINPLQDFGFKKLFVTESNMDLLISFLNEVFKGRKTIVDVVFTKNEHPGDIHSEAGAIFDVLCKGDKGEHFLIEVQRAKQDNFVNRAMFYIARDISSQRPRGSDLKWKYKFSEVYLISIIGNFTLDNKVRGQYITEFCLCDWYNGKIFHDEFGLVFIELPNFTKTQAQLKTRLDKWLDLLKNLGEMQAVPEGFQESVFKKLFSEASYSNLSKEEKMDHDRRQKYIWDNENCAEYALNESLEKGLQLGKKQGLQLGKKQGLQLGEKKGRAEREHETALALQRLNLPLEMISAATHLSIEEIESLN